MVVDNKRQLGNIYAIIATLAICVVAFLFCLVPKGSPDLFWQLRAGSDILATGQVPHHDHYSWTRAGAVWVVPEWLSFVIVAWAYRLAGGFAGPWIVLVAVTMVTGLAYWKLVLCEARSITVAFIVANLGLLAISDGIQIRPFLFTYLFMTAALAILLSVRRHGRPRAWLWTLVPLCALWCNLHQGVLVCIGMLFALALGDAVQGLLIDEKAQLKGSSRLRGKAADLSRERAVKLAEEKAALFHSAKYSALVGIGCLAASLVSPNGWNLYTDFYATVANPVLINLVYEWCPITMVPWQHLWPLAALSALVVCSLAFSQIKRSLGELLVIAVLAVQAALHMRNIPLFALVAAPFAAVHIASAAQRLFGGITVDKRVLALCGIAAMALYCAVSTRTTLAAFHDSPDRDPRRLEQIGKAVVRFSNNPGDVCAFMAREGFPKKLRLFNAYDIGGYLIWALPEDPVFVDGRADVYTGGTIADYIRIGSSRGPQDCRDLLDKYDFDCCITSRGQEALAFGLNPQWAVIYTEPAATIHKGYNRNWIMLRRRPEYADLIARCQRDCPALLELH